MRIRHVFCILQIRTVVKSGAYLSSPPPSKRVKYLRTGGKNRVVVSRWRYACMTTDATVFCREEKKKNIKKKKANKGHAAGTEIELRESSARQPTGSLPQELPGGLHSNQWRQIVLTLIQINLVGQFV